MNSEKVSLLSDMKFSSFEKINDNFMKAKAYVMALGKNRNKSHFSKENVDRAYPTLAYAPVIGHLMVDENGVCHLGGHDYKLDLNDFRLKSQCVPFGVVIPSESPKYEEVTESDGSIGTYLTCEVILWIGRYPELATAFYDENVFTNQSMEIFYSKYEPLKDDESYTDIIDFSFDALCMLQKSDDEKFNVTPCFPSGSIRPITYSINKEEFSTLMNELKQELFTYFNQDNSEKGGEKLDKKLEILQKFNKSIEDLDFSIAELSDEEFEEKMEELFGEKTTEPIGEPVPEVVITESNQFEQVTEEPVAEESIVKPIENPVAFSATYKQKRQALENALDPIIIRDEDGNYLEETYFYVEDFSDEYVFVEKYYWSKDNSEIKFGRFKYEFNEQDMTVELTSGFEEMVKVWLTIEEKEKLDEERAEYETKYEGLQQEFSDYKSEHSFLNSEFNALKDYKESKEKEERLSAESKLFSAYEETIGGTEEFKSLKEKASEFSLEGLRKECLCIVGMYSMTNNSQTQNPQNNSIKFSLEENDDTDDDLYGGLFKKYLKR